MFARFNHNLNKNSGMMLIELMLAVVLGLCLTSVLLQMYLSSQQSYQLQTMLSQLQDNAKIAIDLLKSDIHKAGYVGCSRLNNDFSVTPYQTYAMTAQNKLYGNDNDIVIRYMGFPGVELIESMNDRVTMKANNKTHFSSGDILIISDCKHAEIFQAKKIIFLRESQLIISMSPLQNRYEQYAEIGRLVINHYFIAKTKRKNWNGKPIYSLFVEDINQHKTELVEGVDHIEVAYAVFQDKRLVDVSSNEINDWSKVIGIAVNFTLTSQSIKKNWYMYAALDEK